MFEAHTYNIQRGGQRKYNVYYIFMTRKTHYILNYLQFSSLQLIYTISVWYTVDLQSPLNVPYTPLKKDNKQIDSSAHGYKSFKVQ